MGSRHAAHARGAGRLRTLSCALAALLFLGPPTLQAANIYRYLDENGRTVFDSSIPPEYTKNGYTILDERGRVLRVVPRAPSEAELAELEEQRERERLARLEQERQEENDRMLLRLYRSPDEIARKRDERLEQFNAQLTALNASLAKAEEDVQPLQAQVESAGEAAPGAVSQTLAGARNNKTTLEAQIARLHGEVAETEAAAARDMARLQELLAR